MSNEELLSAATKAIDDLFADGSVSVAKAIENLEELGSDIEAKIAALKCDIDDDN